jgi:hypothetical protein
VLRMGIRKILAPRYPKISYEWPPNYCGKGDRVQVVLITVPLAWLAPQERSMREEARQLKGTPLGWSNRELATRANRC